MRRDQKAERDPFSVALDQFLLEVACDARVKEAGAKVAILLARRYANREHFEATGILVAWPSMRTIAKLLGLFRSRVERGLKLLEETGHVSVDRPEKRGATHHNRYTLHFDNGRTDAAIDEEENGRTDAANSKDPIGRTTVANSIGRTDAANDGGVIGRIGADAMAAPVGPNLLDNPLEGAGALCARPAPISTVEVEDDDQGIDLIFSETDAETGARDRARQPEVGSSAPFSASDHSPAAVPSTEEFHAVEVGFVTLHDLDRLAAEERAAEAAETAIVDACDNEADPVDNAANALKALHGSALDDPLGLASDLLDGFPEGDPEAADRAATFVAKALRRAGSNAAARPIWDGTRHIVWLLFRDSCGCDARADEALADLAVAVRTAGLTLAARAQETLEVADAR